MNRTSDPVFNRLCKAWAKGIVLCLLGLASGAPSMASENTTPAGLSVSGRLGLLSIEASQASWDTLLNEIHSRTGMLILAAPSPGALTLSFQDLPVKQALKRMFGPGVSFILYYPGPINAPLALAFPAQAWILPQPTEGAIHPAPGFAGLRASPTHERSIDGFVQMAYSDDPSARIYALSELVDNDGVDEHIVVSALWDAVSARDINVKTYAIQTLIKRSGGDGLRYAWLALQDPEPSIRMLAIEGARSHDNALPLFQQALLDEDGGVRALAAALLKACLRTARCAG